MSECKCRKGAWHPDCPVHGAEATKVRGEVSEVKAQGPAEETAAGLPDSAPRPDVVRKQAHQVVQTPDKQEYRDVNGVPVVWPLQGRRGVIWADEL